MEDTEQRGDKEPEFEGGTEAGEVMSTPFPKDLVEWLAPGNVLRINYGPDNPNNGIHHIRAVVDGYFVVYCFWKKRGNQWVWHGTSVYDYYLKYQKGRLTLVKSGVPTERYTDQLDVEMKV